MTGKILNSTTADPPGKEIWIRAGVVFAFLLGTGTLLHIWGFKYSETNPITGNFQLTGYPILGYQVGFAWLAGLIYLQLKPVFRRWLLKRDRNPERWLDLTLALILVLTAFFSWSQFPVQEHMFFDQPRPPNYEIYPNSDALLYDRTALNLLTAGELQTYTYRYPEYVAKRPLLAVYQAGLHLLGGLNYQKIIQIQTLIFSVLPAAVYFLTRRLDSRVSGLIAGLLIIFRESNAIQLSSVVTGVHSQLLMSEIPTMLGAVISLNLILAGLNARHRSWLWMMLGGGVLGITMLIRQEIGVISVLVMVIILIKERRCFRRGMFQVGILLAGAVVVLTPWIGRNYQRSGQIYLDVPGNRLDMILSPLGLDGDWLDVKHELEEQSGNLEQSRDLVPSSSGGGLSAPAGSVEIIPPNEQGHAGVAILDHVSNQLTQSVVYLPSYAMYWDLDWISKALIGKLERYYGGVLYSPEAYVRQLPYWWQEWDGGIPSKSLQSVVITVFLIALGISRVWERQGESSLLLLAAFGGYILIFAIVKRSGGRFLQEMDWVTLVYYSVGLSATIRGVQQGWFGKTSGSEMETRSAAGSKPTLGLVSGWLLGAGLLLLGASPVLAEVLIPDRAFQDRLEEVESGLLSGENDLLNAGQREELDQLLSGGEVSLLGRAYYPRYFQAGEDLVDNRDVVLGKLEDRFIQDRFELYLIGTRTSWVVVQIDDDYPELSNGTLIYLAGREADGVVVPNFIVPVN